MNRSDVSDPGQPDPDPSAAARAADERIRRAALRQLDSIDLADDDWRVEPLPRFVGQPVHVDRAASGVRRGGGRTDNGH